MFSLCTIVCSFIAGIFVIYAFFVRSKRTHLTEKLVFISGAAQGIGRAMSIQFAREGSHLVLCDVNQPLLAATVEEIKRTYPKTKIYWDVCDVSERDSVSIFFKKIKNQTTQSVDIIVNNAGVVSGKTILELQPEQISRTFGVNILAHFWICQECLPDMIKNNQGHIVSMASTCGFFSAVALSDYCASKHAVLGFHESLRLEIKKMKANIYTTVVCPNTTNTKMFTGVQQGLEWLIPVLQPEEVAEAVIDAVKTRKQMVILPRLLGLGVKVMVAGVLPQWLRDFIMDVSGVSTGMDHWIGHNANT